MGFIVAIDGPSGSGKGTIARELAKKYHLVNIDTGAMYRCLGLMCIKQKIGGNEKDEIKKVLDNIDIRFKDDGRVILNQKDVTHEIRTLEVGEMASVVSAYDFVREKMVSLQRNMANDNNIVMEGRDITTVVFPNAQYKIYLDASLDVRACRRYKEFNADGKDISYDMVKDNLEGRDYRDMHRECGALMRTHKQFYVDSSNLSVEQVIEVISKYMEEKNDEKIKRE